MSASTDIKLSEFVHRCLEDLLEVECLVGDICTCKLKIKKRNRCTNIKTEHKLDKIQVSPKHKYKSLTRNIKLKQHA